MLKMFLPVSWALRPLTGALLILAIAAPWYIAVGLRTNWEWPRQFFYFENIERAKSAMENHRGPIVYYFPAIMIGFFPWSIFLILSIVRASIAVARSAHSPAQRLLLCWLAVWVGAFSMAATKLPSYVLPVYPALAILVAMMLDQWLKRPEIVKPWMFRVAWSVLGIVGIGFAIGLPIAAQKIQLPEESILGLMGVIPMVGAVATAVWHSHHQQKRVIAAMCVTAVCFSLAFFGWGAVRVSKHQNSPSLMAMIELNLDDRATETPRIGTFHHPASSLTFYAGKPVKPCKDFAAVNELLNESTAKNPVFIVTSESNYEETLKGNLPVDVKVLYRENRFLKNEKIVVLGRESRMAKKFEENKKR
jgi:4-amino-4-deoxy-L-arabinose transferase-like glycosyltransferase